MSDDKRLRVPQDGSRIAMGEDYEVDYWTDARAYLVSGSRKPSMKSGTVRKQ